MIAILSHSCLYVDVQDFCLEKSSVEGSKLIRRCAFVVSVLQASSSKRGRGRTCAGTHRGGERLRGCRGGWFHRLLHLSCPGRSPKFQTLQASVKEALVAEEPGLSGFCSNSLGWHSR